MPPVVNRSHVGVLTPLYTIINFVAYLCRCPNLFPRSAGEYHLGRSVSYATQNVVESIPRRAWNEYLYRY